MDEELYPRNTSLNFKHSFVGRGLLNFFYALGSYEELSSFPHEPSITGDQI